MAETRGRKVELGTPGFGGDSLSSAHMGTGLGFHLHGFLDYFYLESSEEWTELCGLNDKDNIYPWISVRNLVLFSGAKVVVGVLSVNVN